MSTLSLLKASQNKGLSSLNCYMHVRNEELRIKRILDHHRKLGIDHFIIVDNLSDDNTREILLSQSDVTLFSSALPYRESGFGMNVLNSLLDEYGLNSWSLVVDGDEQFVYPHCEHKNLRMLVRYLEKKGFDAVFALMIDMYSRDPVRDVKLESEQPLVEKCRYFDTDSYKKMQARTFPFVEYRGGPRMRKFWRSTDEFHPPTISKVPFIKWKKGMRFVSGAHYLKPSPSRLANITGALLHFKYFDDFHHRAIVESEREQHFSGAREYKRYLAILEEEPTLSLYYNGSAEYTKSTDLVRHGLCSSTNEWGLFF